VNGPPDLTRPASSGWESVHFADEAPNPGSLAAAGIRLASIDGGRVESKQDLMAAISTALEFPDYFGGNWDALDECLRELGSWRQADGHVLAVEHGDGLWKRDPELAGMLVRTWIDAATAWAEKGAPFHLVFIR
jgi:hypothetical protein